MAGVQMTGSVRRLKEQHAATHFCRALRELLVLGVLRALLGEASYA